MSARSPLSSRAARPCAVQPRRAAPGWRAWALAWLLVAVLGAPTLGFMHRAAHGQPGAPSADLPQSSACEHRALARWLERLFGHADGEAGTCPLYDQCSLASGAAVAAAALPLGLASDPRPQPVLAQPKPAAPAAAYHARAPPRL